VVPTGVAAFVVLAALIPAWLYGRRTASVQPRGSRSSLTEVLEHLAVAAITTGPPALAAAMAPDGWRKHVFDLSQWLNEGTPYLARHLRGAAVELSLILICAVLIAEVLAWRARKGVPDEFHPAGAVWSRALAERPVGTYPWVGVMLQDGMLVEGILKTIDLGSTGDDRDIALAAPIRVTPAAGGTAQRHPTLDRLVIPAKEIRWISAIHLAE